MIVEIFLACLIEQVLRLAMKQREQQHQKQIQQLPVYDVGTNEDMNTPSDAGLILGREPRPGIGINKSELTRSYTVVLRRFNELR